jgi:hypothetical protein
MKTSTHKVSGHGIRVCACGCGVSEPRVSVDTKVAAEGRVTVVESHVLDSE